jgi:hypothetical protein
VSGQTNPGRVARLRPVKPLSAGRIQRSGRLDALQAASGGNGPAL